MYAKYIKRILDFTLSLLALIVLSPVLIVIAFLIKIRIKGNAIFEQERVGKDTKIFRLYKFKTMRDPQTRDGKILTDEERLNCVKNGIDILSDEERLTKLGKILRATSLDELPELWNILKGDMSFIGPRPLVKIYLPYYSEKESHRHDVKPGLTGLAQINGRNSTSWKERFEYDVTYVNNINFINDIRIFFKTILVVFKRDDIAQGDEKPEAFNIVRQREWNTLGYDENIKQREYIDID